MMTDDWWLMTVDWQLMIDDWGLMTRVYQAIKRKVNLLTLGRNYTNGWGFIIDDGWLLNAE